MFIIIDTDPVVRKQICDVLHKERIIAVDSIASMIEKLCWFRNDVNLIIARIAFFVETHEKKISERIQNKFRINAPPIVGYFLAGEEDHLSRMPDNIIKDAIILFDPADKSFPRKFIALVKQYYPKLNYEMKSSQAKWQKKDETPVQTIDLRKWFEEEGFIELVNKERKTEQPVDQLVGELNQILKEMEFRHQETDEVDYKKLYFQLKEKYDKLLKLFEELRESL